MGPGYHLECGVALSSWLAVTMNLKYENNLRMRDIHEMKKAETSARARALTLSPSVVVSDYACFQLASSLSVKLEGFHPEPKMSFRKQAEVR